ncbi:DUF4136 domain-containing protein [Coprobacter tertius]|uniref:DUF4136 domain-containing protein n=1 Tax=Coprobacter tertius TaxID=2944915 RepID=A0ABT1MGE8_9BACT|nr:DUF4136 domain-containing protein [Coprobacter tertius]MCP9610916.1 DUF4136 domain-containing protein [Coprobacter tertius]
MKRLIPFLFVALLFTSCEKEPDTGKLDDSFLVYTDYDKTENFGSFVKYYIPDSILLIGESKEAKYWKDENALSIIDAFVDNMDARGYTRTDQKDEADLGLQLSYVEDTHYFTGYNDPYWWWDYPGYWYPWYWGSWGGWYYPYRVVYGYNVGSLLAEMVKLQIDEPDARKKLPIIWDAYMTGLLSGSNHVNTQLAIQAVNQAFVQSPYLKK